MIQLGKLPLTVECSADVANRKAFAIFLTYRQETLQSIYYANNEQRISSTLEDC